MDHDDDAPEGRPDADDEAADEATEGRTPPSTAVAAPVAPLTAADLATGRTRRPAPVDGRPGWALLAVLAISAAILVAVVVHADIDAIADAGWRENALWASGAAVVLLGLALAVVSWTVGSDRADATVARALVVAAVLGVVGAVVVVGLADEQGGELARSSRPSSAAAAPGSAPTEDPALEEPIGIGGSVDPDNMTSVAQPIEYRTRVELQLTVAGRRLVATAMRCRVPDIAQNRVEGIAIGGTWAEPLLVVESPIRQDLTIVARCQQVMLRLPVQAGVARPI